MGNPRKTLDVDYSLEPSTLEIEKTLHDPATELRMDLEAVPLAGFIPLPPGAARRRRFIGRYGQLEIYIFDLYSIALSKIARGFEADIEDVMFMLAKKLIVIGDLERLYQIILPQAAKSDIDPIEFQAYFEEVRRRWSTFA